MFLGRDAMGRMSQAEQSAGLQFRGGPALRDRIAAWLRWISGFDYAANFSSVACVA